jgi:branched-chain amino acid transport system permease protein
LAGALLLEALNHYITIYTEYHGLVLGVVILVIVLGLRRGIADSLFAYVTRRRQGRRRVEDVKRPVLQPTRNEPA